LSAQYCDGLGTPKQSDPIYIDFSPRSEYPRFVKGRVEFKLGKEGPTRAAREEFQSLQSELISAGA
jgi:hypothetical protein